MEGIGKAIARAADSRESSSRQQLAVAVRPIRRHDALPAPFDRDADRDIPDRVVMFWRASGPEGPSDPTLRRALTDDERDVLDRRVLDLRRAIEPVTDATKDDDLVIEVSGMLNGFTSQRRADEQDSLVTAYGYLHAVQQCPPWAIARACEMIRTNRAGLLPQYCPNEPEFRTVVDRLTEQFSDRLKKTQQILEAPIDEQATPKPKREEIEAKLGRPLTPVRSTPPLRDYKPATGYTPEEVAAAEADLTERKRKAIAELEAAEKTK